MNHLPFSLDHIAELIVAALRAGPAGPPDYHRIALDIVAELRDTAATDAQKITINWEALTKFIEALIPLIIALINAFA